MKRRLSTPRAATVVALAALVAVAVAVTPTFAGSFLTSKQAAQLYVTNKKAAGLYLRKKAAHNVFLEKAEKPLVPVGAVAASTAPFTVSSATPQYIPSAGFRFKMPEDGPVAITFSGAATCTGKTAGNLACPILVLIDGQPAGTGKANFALTTTAGGSSAAQPLVSTIVQTGFLTEGGHSIDVQYGGAKDASITFRLLSWNLLVEGYPGQGLGE